MTRNRLTVFGLTGGIASGKSTVARLMREQGVPVIDADALGHMVLEPGAAAYAEVIREFGSDVTREDGTIDRQLLGGKVFDNPERRRALERITHPAIAALARRGLELIAERGETLAIYEAALLVETGTYRGLDGLIVVSCPVALQLERVVARDGLGREAAAARIASQLPLAEKLQVADHVIDNSGDLEDLARATAELLARLRNRAEAGE